MWPMRFQIFGNFTRELSTLLIFNTIKEYPNGLTYYDLTQFGEIPHSKIYRLMKSLEEDGDLIRKDGLSKETGRPKHLYFLSEQGEGKLNDLKNNLSKHFEFMKERFPTENDKFDHKCFLKDATFKVWSSPVEHIVQKNISDNDKLEILTMMESDLTRILKKVRKEKKKLLAIQND